MKEDFFSKFKDYNNELEKVLARKNFSEEAKNLLLSMLYKLEISYNDYYTVKRNVIPKSDYLENIINNIKNSNSIIVVKSNDEEFKELNNREKKYTIDFKLKTIKSIENEFCMLNAILELNDFEIRLTEKYNLIRNSMPYLLNTAYNTENVEVLRDFNAWSWNIAKNEIIDIRINLIYQVIKISLGIDIFEELRNKSQNGYTNVIEIIENIYNKKYGEEITKKLLKLLFKISIIIYIDVNEVEKKRLKEESINIKVELDKITNKKEYITNVTKEKRSLTEKLRQIDLTLNNKELLLKEYCKRNERASEYNKIFSLSHLAEKMQREREKVLKKIEICNANIEPKNYIANKQKLEDEYNFIKDINFDKENDLYKYIDKLLIIFFQKMFTKKIEMSETKEEIINCMYELRYCMFLPYKENADVMQIEIIYSNLENLKKLLLKKMYSMNILNTISTNEKNDIKILEKIFELKIINMEDIYIRINKENEKYNISFYDEKETFETDIVIDLVYNKKDKIKINKKIKLFS